MSVCCKCCVLSGRGLRDQLITRPEESYRLCCVVVCDLETSRMGAPYTYDISRLRVNTESKTEQKAGWTPEPTLTLHNRVSCSCRESNHDPRPSSL